MANYTANMSATKELKSKSLAILASVLLTILIITLQSIFNDYNTIWSLLIIPSLIILVVYPTWLTIIIVYVVSGVIKYVTEVFIYNNENLDELFVNTVINFTVLLVIAYFRIENKKLIDKLKGMTLSDTLTGINNRRYFEIFLQKAIPIANETRSPLTAISFDIDHFKVVNDTYGHPFGDYCLRRLSEIVNQNIRQCDSLIRVGGEEFMIVMPQSELKVGQKIAERVRKEVENQWFCYRGEKTKLTISLGVSTYIHDESQSSFLKRLDDALYQAKEQGRNRTITL